MVTTIVKAIKPSGLGDYTTLSAWNIGRRGNLVTRDSAYPGTGGDPSGTVEVAEIYSGGNVGPVDSESSNGWVTNSTHYIWLRAATGEGHTGVFNASKAYVQATVGYQSCIRFDLGYTHIGPGLSLETVASGNPAGIIFRNSATVGPMTLEGCIIRRAVAQSAGSYFALVDLDAVLSVGDYNVIKNCILYDTGTGSGSNSYIVAIGLNYTRASNTKIYNCTIMMKVAYYGIARYAGTVISQNNYISAGTSYLGTITKGTNDATSNTEAVTSNLRSVLYTTANFKNVTLGSEDFHLVVSAANKLLDHGANLTSEGVTTDIIGTARPQFGTFDIGAFENDIPICWNYTARYKNSNKLFKASGCGVFPKNLKVPGNVDRSTGRMIDDGILINPDEYHIV